MLRRSRALRISSILATAAVLLASSHLFAQSVRRIVPPLDTGEAVRYTSPVECARCHPRQFRENAQAVHSGYRNFSPTFNTLEIGSNYAIQLVNALDATTDLFQRTEGGELLFRTNLRPVYADANFVTLNPSNRAVDGENMRAGLCVGCHAGHGLGLGIQGDAGLNVNESRVRRDIPPWNPRDLAGHITFNERGQPVVTGADTRPLRDFHFVNDAGQQVLPAEFGGLPPPGSRTTMMGYGIHCDYCHNVVEPDLERSLQGDGFANTSLRLLFSSFKAGPFVNAFPPLDDFHMSTNRRERIEYIRSPMLCNGCHDVRIPTADIVTPDNTTNAPNVLHFRLENLSTEWTIGPYADAALNPFGSVVRCQDCHMSLYPYSGNSTYSVTDPVTGDRLEITSPTPSVFPINFAAEGELGVARGDFGTRANIPLPRRKVVTHYFTGIDVPLLYDSEMKAFLGLAELPPGTTNFGRDNGYWQTADRLIPPGTPKLSDPQPDDIFANYPADAVDEYGIPLNLEQRRDDLARAAVRIDLDRTDATAKLGEDFMARVRAVALTGHRLPAGFSQERGVWVQLTVSGKRKDSGEDVILYESGYLVDKPHPETGELEPDGNFHDEDQEHLEAIVNPFTHDNEVFNFGPDNGPHARIFEGLKEGLVFFRNELVRIYGPEYVEGELHGVPFRNETGIPRLNRNHPRTLMPLTYIIEEETFSAGLSSFVDNWRSLPPLYPRTYGYDIHLPSAEELAEYGIELEGPLTVTARVHFQHFPPLFLRFLARVGGAYVERNLNNSPVLALFEGLRGPADRNLNMWNEQRIDDLLRIVYDIATAEVTVPLEQ